MSNLLQYANKSSVIDQMTTDIVNELFNQYQTGQIKNETELFYLVKLALDNFYQNIHRSSFVYRPAISTPVSDDYNQMIKEAITDLKCILTDCESIGQALSASFTEAETTRRLFNSELKYITQKIKDMKEQTAKNTDGTVYIQTESFSSLDNTDNFLSNNSAYVNRGEHILMLTPTTQSNLNEEIEIEILPTSNGMPGNTKVADIISGAVYYDGNTDPHFDLSEMLDGNSDTWFEYETFNVKDSVIDECGNYGFNFKEGLEWITDDGTLKLHMKLTLASRPICNWISLTPFISEQKGVKPAHLVKCLISDGASKVQQVAHHQLFDDNIVLIFEPQEVESVTLEFEQDDAYDVKVGHQYYLKTPSSSLGYYETQINREAYRVDGETPSVQSLGLKYDPKTRGYAMPSTSNVNEHLKNEELTRRDLFEAKSDTKDSKSYLELIPAKRYSIGIKKINLSNYQFSDNGEHVSKAYTTKNQIKSITLEAEEMIPTTFDPKEQWIRYYISIDDGAKWHPIYPKHRAYDGACTYEINNGDIQRYITKPSYNGRIGMITSFTTVNQVKLKIVLSKPKGEVNQSPILYGYKLNIKTGDDTVDY